VVTETPPAATPETSLAPDASESKPRKNGKGSWKGSYKQPPSVPADFEVDKDARYKGTVAHYSKLSGYGFIQVANEGVVPENMLFVHWRSIRTEDRFPFLVKGMEVEFGITKWRAQGNVTTLRAKTVTKPGGGNLEVQDQIDGEKKTFVGGQELRYTGKLKFYNPVAGFGYVNIDSGSVLDPKVPTELRVERAEVNCAGAQGGRWMSFLSDVPVEFGIWTTSKGAFKAYNMTLPGGVPLSQSALEHRATTSTQEYTGEVKFWNWSWGFIKAEPSENMPPEVQAKLQQQAQAAKDKAAAKGKTGEQEELIYFRQGDLQQGVRLKQGVKVIFKIYTDDKGAGAYDVATVATES